MSSVEFNIFIKAMLSSYKSRNKIGIILFKTFQQLNFKHTHFKVYVCGNTIKLP